MMRGMMSALLCLSLAALIGYAQDKKEDKPDGPKDFAELRKEFITEFRKAKEAEEKDKLFKTYGPKFLEVAQKGERGAFGGLVFSFQIAEMSNNRELLTKSLNLLREKFLDDPELERALPVILEAAGVEGVALCRELMDKGKNKKIQAVACSTLLEEKEKALLRAKGDAAKKIEAEMAELRKIGVEKFNMKDIYIGGKLADLASKDLDGKDVKLSDHQGKVIVLDIWATWCGPCRAMIPQQREMVERLKDKPFALISVSFDDKVETVKKFHEKNEMPWVHWFNGRDGSLDQELNIRYFPTIFVLDAKGVIRYKGVRGTALNEAVDKLLSEVKK